MPRILYEYANLWPCGPPSYFLVQNKNTSMFLAKQFFLPPPSLPHNVNEKCASQNRNRKDGKFLFHFFHNFVSVTTWRRRAEGFQWLAGSEITSKSLYYGNTTKKIVIGLVHEDSSDVVTQKLTLVTLLIFSSFPFRKKKKKFLLHLISKCYYYSLTNWTGILKNRWFSTLEKLNQLDFFLTLNTLNILKESRLDVSLINDYAKSLLPWKE